MRKIYLLLMSIFVVATMSSCEKVFCTANDDGEPDNEPENNETEECTKNYASVSGISMNYWWSTQPGANPPNNKFVDFSTGTTYETETADCDMRIGGNDNRITFNGLNGTKFSSSSFTVQDWRDGLCDSNLLPDANGGEPSSTSLSVSTAAATGSHLLHFVDKDGKYGLIFIEKIYDLTINDWWRVSSMSLKIQK